LMCVLRTSENTSLLFFFFFSSRRRHTRFSRDWSSDVCSSDLKDEEEHLVDTGGPVPEEVAPAALAVVRPADHRRIGKEHHREREIGRASCRKECRSRW